MRLGLEAIGAVCERLGRPEQRVPCVLIGGTNGKGSAAATLSSIARSAGVRAGLYTSPHLIRVTERIRIDEEDISAEGLDAALAEVFAAAEGAPPIPLTYFEALTAAAFLAFSQSRLELAILEVGLGGRFDATNVAPARLSVVTSIGLDHTEELGPTLARIASEKAGIFRAGRPALARAQEPEALEVLREAALRLGAQWHGAEEELGVEVERVSLDGTRFRLATPRGQMRVATRLPGAHQAWNAALAIRAAELLSEEEPRLARVSLPDALARVRWPGRLERIRAGGREVLLDGCHNTEGARALARFLRETALSGRCPLVFGAMADKDIEGIAAVLLPEAHRVLLAAPAQPRAASTGELSRRVAAVCPEPVETAGVADALERALALPGSDPIIVAGSLYLVGEARAWLLSEGNDTPS
jgi:dihydrofolate synthase/folylpolyglutamate synthase